MMTDRDRFHAAAIILGLSAEDEQELLGTDDPQGAGTMSKRALQAIAIAVALGELWPDDERRRAWLEAPNQKLGGRSARELLLSQHVKDVRLLRRHVEYWAYDGW